MLRTSTPGDMAPQQALRRHARERGARVGLRRAWLLAHRWLGLSLGLVLLVAGLSGSLLVLGEPLDEALNARVLELAEPATLSMEQALHTLRAAFGPGAGLTLRPPREPMESLQVFVRGDWHGTVFLHPATGQELGRRGEHEGFFGFLFVLHSTLFAGEVGKAVLASAALAYVVMLVSGLVLWWPARWRHAFTVRRAFGLTRTLFDLHRVAGATLGMLILLSAASGAYMAWRPLAHWATALSGDVPPVAPRMAAAAGPRMPLDAAVGRAESLFPGAQVGYVQIAPKDSSPVRVRLRLPDDPHPNGLTSVWLHPRSGEVLAVHRWSELDLGTWAYSYVYPFHTGELGGTPMRVATFFAGATLAGFGITGAWLWWRRQRGQR